MVKWHNTKTTHSRSCTRIHPTRIRSSQQTCNHTVRSLTDLGMPMPKYHMSDQFAPWYDQHGIKLELVAPKLTKKTGSTRKHSCNAQWLAYGSALIRCTDEQLRAETVEERTARESGAKSCSTSGSQQQKSTTWKRAGATNAITARVRTDRSRKAKSCRSCRASTVSILKDVPMRLGSPTPNDIVDIPFRQPDLTSATSSARE